MIQRIHDCLDGTISRSVLTEEERRVLDDLRVTVEESLAILRQTPPPDITETVMAQIGEQEAAASWARAGEPAAPDYGADRRVGPGILERLRVALDWIWTPRPIQLRPAWALAALTVVALATGIVEAPEPPQSASTPVLYVRFELETADASTVALAGSFTSWEPRYQLREQAPGQWTALVPLRPGIHDYGFVVDGERWVADPAAIPVKDGFGGVNSRIALLGPEGPAEATGAAPTGASS